MPTREQVNNSSNLMSPVDITRRNRMLRLAARDVQRNRDFVEMRISRDEEILNREIEQAAQEYMQNLERDENI